MWGRAFAASDGIKPRKPSSALDLYEELENYEEAGARKEEPAAAPKAKRPQREIEEAGKAKTVMAKEPKIRGSPRRLGIISSLLVGKSYPELKKILPTLRNSGARSAVRAIDNAKKRAHERWEIASDHRLVVEQSWVGKGEVSARPKFHARGKVRTTVLLHVELTQTNKKKKTDWSHASSMGQDVGADAVYFARRRRDDVSKDGCGAGGSKRADSQGALFAALWPANDCVSRVQGGGSVSPAGPLLPQDAHQHQARVSAPSLREENGRGKCDQGEAVNRVFLVVVTWGT